MQQYREAKERHPGMLLLFRMGDFYELFDDDAEVASRVLGLTLTSRDKIDPDGRLPAPGSSKPTSASSSTPATASPSATRSKTRPWPRVWSGAKSPASSRPAPSPKTTCSTRGRPTTSSPWRAVTGRRRRRRRGLGRPVDRPVSGRRRARATACRRTGPAGAGRSASVPRRQRAKTAAVDLLRPVCAVPLPPVS